LPAAGVRELVYKPNTVDEICEVVARLANTRPVGIAAGMRDETRTKPMHSGAAAHRAVAPDEAWLR
jgi:hypothetical protein